MKGAFALSALEALPAGHVRPPPLSRFCRQLVFLQRRCRQSARYILACRPSATLEHAAAFQVCDLPVMFRLLPARRMQIMFYHLISKG